VRRDQAELPLPVDAVQVVRDADGGLVIRLDDDTERTLYSEDVIQLRDIEDR